MLNRLEYSFQNVTNKVFKVTLHYNNKKCEIYTDSVDFAVPSPQGQIKEETECVVRGFSGEPTDTDLEAVRRALILRIDKDVPARIVHTTKWYE